MIAPTLRENELTVAESDRLEACEKIVERGIATFVEVGQALAEIRDSKLYRLDYGTFADYCSQRWGMSDRRARQLMDAASVVEEIGTTGSTSGVKSGTTVPLSGLTEGAIRPLTTLPNDVQREAVDAVKEKIAAGASPREAVKEVVAAHRPPAPTKPAPATEPEPAADEHDDYADELEDAQRTIEQLQKENASLRTDDAGTEIRKLSALRAQEQANNLGLQREISALKEGIRKRDSLLNKIRKALGADRDTDLVAAIEALRQ